MGLLEGAGIALVFFLIGRFLPARRKDPKPAKPVDAVCGCKHHHSFHDPQAGWCHSLMYVPGTVARDSHHEPCTCKQYSGPLPMPEYYAPEIAREAGE